MDSDGRQDTPADAPGLPGPARQELPARAEAERWQVEAVARAQALDALHEVAVAASGLLDPAALGDLVVRQACRLLDAASAALLWWESERETFRPIADTGLHPDVQPKTSQSRGEGLIGLVFEQRGPAVIEDYLTWEPGIVWAKQADVRSAVAAPLLVGDRCVGVLVVRSHTPRQFTPDDVQMLSLLAAHVGPPLEAARLRAESERLRQEAEALAELARQGATALDTGAGIELVNQYACRLLHADYALVALVETDGSMTRRGVWGNRSDVWRTTSAPLRGAAPRAVAAGHTLVFGRIGANPAFPNEEFAMHIDEGGRTALATPLFTVRGPVGALVVGWRADVTLTPAQVRLAETLAGHAATIVENARAHERERALAAEAAARATEVAVSEDRLRTLYEAIACGIVVRDATGHILHTNEAARLLLGLGDLTLTGLADADCDHVYEDGSPMPWDARPPMAAVRSRQPVRQVTAGVLRPDGERTWLQIDAVPLLGPDGAVVQVVSTFVDVTRHKWTEAAVLRQTSFYETLLQAQSEAGEGFVIVEHRKIAYANDAFCRMSGYSLLELINFSSYTDLLQEDSHARLAEQVAQDAQTEGGRGRSYGAAIAHKDGRRVDVEFALRPLGSDGNEQVIVICRDITERKLAEQALAEQVLHDALTGLPNRVLLIDRLEQAVNQQDATVALLLLDLDHFKEVNDTFGHHTGDLLLQQIGPRLREVVRGSNTVARLGGDEFAMVLRDAGDAAGAVQAARRVLQTLEAAFMIDGLQLDVGASVGIALAPDHGADAATLLRRADVAMYVAKRTASGHALYTPELDDNSPNRLALLGELRQALENNQLQLYYQPLVEAPTGRLVRVEALVRWQHPRHGLLLPDEFVPLAERTGLIRPLTTWVLHEVARQWRGWHAVGLDIGVAMNVSARSLQDAHFAESIAGQLRDGAMPPPQLHLEITEGELMADPALAFRVLAELRAIGVRVGVDDFGAGYSSLAYLKRLPLDEIKIDKSFIVNMARDPGDATIVRSTVQLGHHLGLGVVAEGVEDSQVWQMLTEFGCDLAQGHLFSPPLPPAALEDWIRQQPHLPTTTP